MSSNGLMTFRVIDNPIRTRNCLQHDFFLKRSSSDNQLRNCTTFDLLVHENESSLFWTKAFPLLLLFGTVVTSFLSSLLMTRFWTVIHPHQLPESGRVRYVLSGSNNCCKLHSSSLRRKLCFQNNKYIYTHTHTHTEWKRILIIQSLVLSTTDCFHL